MKTELLDVIELGKLVRLVSENGKDNQYCKEMIVYVDNLHTRIRSMELSMEVINDQSKRHL